MLEDIAVATGGTVISTNVGLTLDKATLEQLGTAKKVEVTKENTTIIDGAGQAEPSKTASGTSARRSKPPRATTTVKSFRNALPSSPAAWPSSRSVPPPKSK